MDWLMRRKVGALLGTVFMLLINLENGASAPMKQLSTSTQAYHDLFQVLGRQPRLSCDFDLINSVECSGTEAQCLRLLPRCGSGCNVSRIWTNIPQYQYQFVFTTQETLNYSTGAVVSNCTSSAFTTKSLNTSLQPFAGLQSGTQENLNECQLFNVSFWYKVLHNGIIQDHKPVLELHVHRQKENDHDFQLSDSTLLWPFPSSYKQVTLTEWLQVRLNFSETNDFSLVFFTNHTNGCSEDKRQIYLDTVVTEMEHKENCTPPLKPTNVASTTETGSGIPTRTTEEPFIPVPRLSCDFDNSDYECSETMAGIHPLPICGSVCNMSDAWTNTDGYKYQFVRTRKDFYNGTAALISNCTLYPYNTTWEWGNANQTSTFGASLRTGVQRNVTKYQKFHISFWYKLVNISNNSSPQQASLELHRHNVTDSGPPSSSTILWPASSANNSLVVLNQWLPVNVSFSGAANFYLVFLAHHNENCVEGQHAIYLDSVETTGSGLEVDDSVPILTTQSPDATSNVTTPAYSASVSSDTTFTTAMYTTMAPTTSTVTSKDTTTMLSDNVTSPSTQLTNKESDETITVTLAIPEAPNTTASTTLLPNAVTENPEDPPFDFKSENLMLIIIIPILLTMPLISVILFLYYRRRLLVEIQERAPVHSDNARRDSAFSVFSKNFRDLVSPKPSDRWEISRSRITIGEVIGKGAFGQVCVGKIDGTILATDSSADTIIQFRNREVAIKMLTSKATANEKEAFLKEIEVMKSIGYHKNVVSLIGCCISSEPFLLIEEYCFMGDLRKYLLEIRTRAMEKLDTNEVYGDLSKIPMGAEVTLGTLLSYARQIAMGMEYIHKNGYVHRDLAARNILLTNPSTVKICDFGLTRFLEDDQRYAMNSVGKLPVKWMAIESLFDFTFTPSTDIWSFGVLLFEIVTLGGIPYPTIQNKDLLVQLKKGYRMECPDNCPQNLYFLMLSCWNKVPSLRPPFTELDSQLEQILEASMERNDYLQMDPNRDYYISPQALDSE